MTKGFNIYRNGVHETFMGSRSLKRAKQYIRDNATIGTHMGEWSYQNSRLPETLGRVPKYGRTYRYSTTVGVYYTFQPAIERIF